MTYVCSLADSLNVNFEMNGLIDFKGRQRQRKNHTCLVLTLLVGRYQPINLKTAKEQNFLLQKFPQLKNMQISRIIEFMQREQCENENEEIKFILWHKNVGIDTVKGNNITGKSFDSHI